MRLFLAYLKRTLREHSTELPLIVTLMSVVAVTEGSVLALLPPLLALGLGQTVVSDNGFMMQTTTWLTQGLSLIGVTPSLAVVLVIIVGIFFTQGCVRYYQMYLQNSLLRRYETVMVRDVFNDYLGAPWEFFLKQKVGHLVNLLVVETGRAAAALQFTLQTLSNVCIIVVYGIFSLFISWKITLLGFVLGILASLFLKRFMGKMEQLGIQTTQTNNAFHALSSDFLSSAKMIQSSSTQVQALMAIDQLNSQKTFLRYRAQMNAALIPSFYFPLVMAMLSVVMFVSIESLSVPFATLMLFVYIFYRLMPALSALYGAYEQALIYIPSLSEIDAMRKAAQSDAVYRYTTAPIEFDRRIRFENVSFAYDGTEPVVSDLTLEIPKGKMIALSGASGAGKTTILDLLLGLLQPQTGAILIDNTPLEKKYYASWRRKIGYLSQDVFLFHDTMRANLVWMSPDSSDAQIQQALHLANAREFVVNLPHGLETIIGDRGVKLSGGQRQRLALARLILQDPEIIILDEATSALDVTTEEDIRRNVEELFGKKTRIIISHRNSTIRQADIIYIVRNGRLEDSGSWDDLTRKGLMTALLL